MSENGYGKNRICEIGAGLGLLLLLALEFLLHRHTVFMMDDLWYGTNLVTGEPLGSLSDVLQSQAWHFKNWGGRNVTHGLLQLVLMSGEWGADLFNLIMTLLLGVMICKAADVKGFFWLFAAEVLLIGFNANVKMSMFWQSGTVNYVYSTVWLLFFLWIYLRQLAQPDAKPLPGCAVWILPLGLAAGWSNENMGPACALAAAGITGYLRFFRKRKVCAWMTEGIVSAAIGSILVIAAPGNFVRASAIERTGFGEWIYRRVYAMLCATGEFLFPTLAVLSVVLLLYLCVFGGRLEPVQVALLLTALAAHGAMFLSPHYPDRATFGIMAVCIVVILSLLRKMWEQCKNGKKWILSAVLACFVNAVYILSRYLIFT